MSSAWLRGGLAAALAGLAVALTSCGRAAGTEASPAARIGALEQRIDALERKAERLQDVRDIKRLQRAFGYYFDAAQWDEMAQLFSDDATLEMGLDGVYAGKAHIRAYLHALGGGHLGLDEGELNEHMQLQPVIDLSADGRTARARWRTVVLQGRYGHSAEWGEGPYENDYVKEHGVWKIHALHWYQTFLVPYAGGWVRNPDLNAGVYVSGALRPDRPPTVRYPTWPGVYIPPFHYANPVTGR